jgi:haloalkane dehalogenase
MWENIMFVEIRIKGNLKPDWSDWLEGLTVTNQANGETILTGELLDQAALLGLLNRIHGLNLTLLSFSQSDKAELPNFK